MRAVRRAKKISSTKGITSGMKRSAKNTTAQRPKSPGNRIRRVVRRTNFLVPVAMMSDNDGSPHHSSVFLVLGLGCLDIETSQSSKRGTTPSSALRFRLSQRLFSFGVFSPVVVLFSESGFRKGSDAMFSDTFFQTFQATHPRDYRWDRGGSNVELPRAGSTRTGL